MQGTSPINTIYTTPSVRYNPPNNTVTFPTQVPNILFPTQMYPTPSVINIFKTNSYATTI